VGACIRELQQLRPKPSTRQGQVEIIAWLCQHEVGLAVMEASGTSKRDDGSAIRW